jgi:hypothetical protein
LLASKSQVGDSGAVPFYLQHTLGGSDLDGNRALASCDDFRFRGPRVLLMQETIEHAIWGPVGFLLQGEHGKVAAQNQNLNFTGLHVSLLGSGGRPTLHWPALRLTDAAGGSWRRLLPRLAYSG